MRRASLLFGALLLGACSEPSGPNGSPVPAPVYWAEWPAAVTATAPDSIRLLVLNDFCSHLTLSVAVSASFVTVVAEAMSTGQVCPLALPAYPHDTTIPLPVLSAPYGLPAFYSVQIPTTGGLGNLGLRTVGTIRLAAARDTTRQLGGSALLTTDSTGCTLIGPGFGFVRRYAVTNPPVFDGKTRMAFVGGSRVTSGPVACGAVPAVHLDFAEVNLLP